jgi:ATP-dependent DNA ligase
MKSRSAPSDPLIKAIKQWKKDQAIISLTIEEMEKEAKGQDLIIEQKVDGQSAILDYKEGTTTRFGSLGGMIMWDLPLCEDLNKTLKAKGIHQMKAVGEMAGYDGKKIIPFNESESLIKNRKADKTKVHWFPYQILELNGEKIVDDFKSYKKFWPEFVRIFRHSKYAHPVTYYQGGIPQLKTAWKKLVLKEKNEGIVVRMSNNKVYKCKPIFTYDLVVLAVGSKKGKNWPKHMIGMCLMAFMDNNHVFRTAGHVASGFNDKESKELFSWAQKNKVSEDNTYVWVKPQKIMEIQWERTTIKEMPAYKYSKGKYEPVEKLMSGTIVKPRFIRWRTDKSINPNDLRLTQVPDWSEKKKMAMKVASCFLSLTVRSDV